MKTSSSGIDRRGLLSALALLPTLHVPLLTASAEARTAASASVLPSWNDGPAKQAIIDFVRVTTEQGNPKFVPPEERIATFDQDGTLWVEHPVYSQMMYCLDRVPVLAEKKPEDIAQRGAGNPDWRIFGVAAVCRHCHIDTGALAAFESGKDGHWIEVLSMP